MMKYKEILLAENRHNWYKMYLVWCKANDLPPLKLVNFNYWINDEIPY